MSDEDSVMVGENEVVERSMVVEENESAKWSTLIKEAPMIEDWMADTIYEGRVYPRYSWGNYGMGMPYCNWIRTGPVAKVYRVMKDGWVSERVSGRSLGAVQT